MSEKNIQDNPSDKIVNQILDLLFFYKKLKYPKL